MSHLVERCATDIAKSGSADVGPGVTLCLGCSSIRSAWAPFILAPLVRGTGVDDPPHPIARVAGVPTSMLGAAGTTFTAVAGWLLDQCSR